MARRNFKNLLSLLIAIFLLESPRLHVETRSLEKQETQDQTTNYSDELTTQAFSSIAKNTSTTTSPKPIEEATTAFSDNSPDSFR